MRQLLFQICTIFVLIISPSFASANNVDKTMKVSAFVQAVSEDVVEILNKNSDATVIKNKLTDKFQKTVDITWIAKFVVGKHWRTFTKEEQQSYLHNYEKFITASYVPVFKNYNGQKINIVGVKYIGSGYYIVKTSIVKENSSTEYIIEYRVKDLNGLFKVRDIIAEGVSLISTQRSEFSSLLTSQGLSSLNKQLIEKANNLNN